MLHRSIGRIGVAVATSRGSSVGHSGDPSAVGHRLVLPPEGRRRTTDNLQSDLAQPPEKEERRRLEADAGSLLSQGQEDDSAIRWPRTRQLGAGLEELGRHLRQRAVRPLVEAERPWAREDMGRSRKHEAGLEADALAARLARALGRGAHAAERTHIPLRDTSFVVLQPRVPVPDDGEEAGRGAPVLAVVGVLDELPERPLGA
mmetsp:Transcript_39010/g.125376  ORF Transcript_39010/g.125376 Transcript_39010/m.125376 type:complete len:203 (-) Transcript_39010:314-922(-)